MDEADQGNEKAEQHLASALARRKESGPPPVGYCYSCGEVVGPGRRWCDILCRDDWEKYGK